jgi:hypothetical protein
MLSDSVSQSSGNADVQRPAGLVADYVNVPLLFHLCISLYIGGGVTMLVKKPA